jgi:PAS domain-containing protein
MDDSQGTTDSTLAVTYGVEFRNGPIIGLVTDADSAVIRDVNRAAWTFFRVDRAALVGKPLLHFVARGDTRMFRQQTRDLTKVASLVVALRPRGGRPCVMRLTVEPTSGRLLWWAVPALVREHDAGTARGTPEGVPPAGPWCYDDLTCTLSPNSTE